VHLRHPAFIYTHLAADFSHGQLPAIVKPYDLLVPSGEAVDHAVEDFTQLALGADPVRIGFRAAG
jgi:hypothetical protein